MKLNNIILRPIVTEKSVAMQSEINSYIFEVNYRASKGSVAREIKETYGVDPIDVRTSILPGKKRRLTGTRRFTKTSKRKKAIVKLKEGQKIDLVGK